MRPSLAVGLVLGLVVLSSVPASAQAGRAALVLELEGVDVVALAPALQGSMVGNGYELVSEGELRAAMAFAGVQAALTPAAAEQVRQQLGAVVLVSVSVRPAEGGAAFAAVRRFAGGEPGQRFAELDASALIGFAVGALVELENEAVGQVQLQAQAPLHVEPTPPVWGAPFVVPIAEPVVVAQPSAPPASGGGGDVILAGMNLAVISYVFGPALTIGLERGEERIAISFIPIAGAFWQLAYIDFDDRDQTIDAVFLPLLGVGQIAGLITLFIGLAIDGGGGGETTATVAPVSFSAAPLPGGGFAASMSGTF